ncbi:SH3 domain-containing protein (plasmid) [Embleya sp. NBC_00888]|uniref:SH3 domain-containing protein n=1 Tax=Embleya sp. NBC_00888 TaxID=2975960 RepID=UPI002F9195F8|nr:SH3 domain-containing protein [Embleya sp. NBC_00888]
MSKFGRRVAAATASVSLLVGAGIALAPTAAAVDHPLCNVSNNKDRAGKITGDNVSLRKTKGTYKSPILRVLQKNAKVTVYCKGLVAADQDLQYWYYVKHNATGIKGWVYASYVS